MTAEAETGSAARTSRWRIALWGLAATLLLLPFAAMQFSDEVAWTGSDFAAFGALLAGAGVGFELASRQSADRAYRVAVAIAIAIAGAFALV